MDLFLQRAPDRLDGIRAELDGLVAKLRTYLGNGAAGDLQQRFQQTGKTGDEIRLLSEIERIVTAHGLVEFRGTLSMLLDRMESAAFEVGVFGRVSSGKSSLLNYILQTDVLPIGVTPVKVSTRRAMLSLDSLTCIARILRLRLLLICQTYRPSRTTFEFWVNGTGLRRSLQSAVG
jgi:Dynamin family